MKTVKTYLGISLELLWAVWGSVRFQLVHCSSLYLFSRSTGPLQHLVNVNCRVLFFVFFPFIFISWRLITLQYCSGFCHTLTWTSQSVAPVTFRTFPLLYFGFLFFQVSIFHPDSRVTYLGSLVQFCYGERGTLKTNIAGMCGECL